jgi:hypothetical protein
MPGDRTNPAQIATADLHDVGRQRSQRTVLGTADGELRHRDGLLVVGHQPPRECPVHRVPASGRGGCGWRAGGHT